jgi:hypothetical protein
VLADSIAALGLMIAFYYGMTGFACVWYYRRAIRAGARDLLIGRPAAVPRAAAARRVHRGEHPVRRP